MRWWHLWFQFIDAATQGTNWCWLRTGGRFGLLNTHHHNKLNPPHLQVHVESFGGWIVRLTPMPCIDNSCKTRMCSTTMLLTKHFNASTVESPAIINHVASYKQSTGPKGNFCVLEASKHTQHQPTRRLTALVFQLGSFTYIYSMEVCVSHRLLFYIYYYDTGKCLAELVRICLFACVWVMFSRLVLCSLPTV